MDKTEEDIKDNRKIISETFKMLDKNKDGMISAEELVKGIIAIGYNPTQLEAEKVILKYGTLASSGGLSYDEFEKFMMKKLKSKEYEKKCILKAFQKFDLDKDGFITVDELVTVLSSNGKYPVSRTEIEEWLVVDKNNDNKLDIEEFTEKLTQDYKAI